MVISNSNSYYRLIASLINAALLRKYLLLFAGLVEAIRKSVSFYHCVALSILCQILTVPVFLSKPEYRRAPQEGIISTILFVAASIMHLTLLLYLLPAASQVGWCSCHGELETFQDTMT